MAIEYLRPEDSYNIDVFNRNFQAVEAAVKGIRPLDWINLSDISQEKDPAVVALLHIPATGLARFLVALEGVDQNIPAGKFLVNWGDGSGWEEHTYTGTYNTYLVHQYQYGAIDAPKTINGDKQVICTLTFPAESTERMWDVVGFFSSFTEEGKSINVNTSLTREIAVQAGGCDNISVSIGSNNNLSGFWGYGIESINGALCPALKEVHVTGENFVSLSGSYWGGGVPLILDIPKDNPYLRFSLTNSTLRELELHNLGYLEATPSLGTNSRGSLNRLIAGGLRRGITAQSSNSGGLSREAIVEFFESLGQADMALSTGNRTLNLKGAGGYYDLTDADKQIAIEKGFVVP